MSPRKLTIGFLWRFALGYGLLIMPWAGFNEAYARYFRTLGQAVFAEDRGERLVRFEPVPAGLGHGLDTRIALANRTQTNAPGSGPVHYLELDTRGIGWVPTALLLALVLATPVSWRRRLSAVVWGMIAIHGFLMLTVAVSIWNNSADLGLLTLAPIWKQIASGLEETLVTQLGASFVAPVLIWLMAMLGQRDLIEWYDSTWTGR